MAILYRHIRKDKNEPFYIGIGENEKRAFTKKSRNKYWTHIVKNSPYEVEILFDNLSWEDACKKEKEFIKLYGRKDNGTGILSNMTDGGDTPPNHKGKIRSDEFRKKCSDARKGIVFSDEHKKNLSTSHIGIKLSSETRIKLSNVKKGKVLTEEHKEKIRISNIGKKRSEETKIKMRTNHKGNTGLKFSEEHKKKISEAIKRKYLENQN
jgi:predicted GIY-YIG superfamily endonuclease